MVSIRFFHCEQYKYSHKLMLNNVDKYINQISSNKSHLWGNIIDLHLVSAFNHLRAYDVYVLNMKNNKEKFIFDISLYPPTYRRVKVIYILIESES